MVRVGVRIRVMIRVRVKVRNSVCFWVNILDFEYH